MLQIRFMSRVSSFLFALLISLVSQTTWAAPPGAEAARSFIRANQDKLNSAVANSQDPKNDQAVGAIFDAMLDYSHFAEAALGKHKDSLSEAQRTRFASVLEQLIQASYRRNLRAPKLYRVEYTGEAEAKDGILVSTVASHRTNKREEPLHVDYVVAKVGGSYRIRDIVTAGVSLLNNYRRQFGRVIDRKGFDELMRLMEKKLNAG